MIEIYFIVAVLYALICAVLYTFLWPRRKDELPRKKVFFANLGLFFGSRSVFELGFLHAF